MQTMWINFKFWLITRLIISLDILCSYMQFNRVNNKENHEGNDPCRNIPTRKETTGMLRFTSRLPCQWEWVVRVQALARDILLCSWARHFTLTVPLSTQVYKWVPTSLMLWVTLQQTIIPSRGINSVLLPCHVIKSNMGTASCSVSPDLHTFVLYPELHCWHVELHIKKNMRDVIMKCSI